MQQVLKQLIEHRSLSKEQAKEIILGIGEDNYAAPEIVGLMVALQTRTLTLEEIKGFREALLELSIQPKIDPVNAIDLCGTGGDGKNTFNISTTTAFVLASMGYRVIKHGNYGVSSLCGSSNVLEELGVNFTADSTELNNQLTKTNLCFLHAPLFHPVMKKVAPLRKELGIPTFFNIMGPLVNPVQPDFQLTGTFNLNIARLYHHVLQSERKNYNVIYSLDGYDEISLTGDTRVFGKYEDYIFNANKLDLDPLNSEDLYGGSTVKEAGTILTNILKGKGTQAQHHVIASNVTNAIRIFDIKLETQDIFNTTLAHIQSGKAFTHFQEFLTLQKQTV